MSDNVVLRILEVLQDQIKKIRTEDKNEILSRAANDKTEILSHINNLSGRLSTIDLAWRMEGAKRQGDLEDRIATLEAEVAALKAASSE